MKPESVIRAILFDVGWTLIYPKPTRKEVTQDYLQTLGYSIPSEVFESAHNVAVNYYNSHRWQPEAVANIVQFWQAYYHIFIQGLGIQEPNITTALQIHANNAVIFHLYPETLLVLKELRRRGYLIGVVSNWSAALLDILDNLGLNDCLDSIVVCDIVGYQKPQSEIFKYALNSLGVLPEEAVHVGDDVEADVEGAQSAGIRSIWLDRVGMNKSIQSERIQSLEELLTLTLIC